MTDSPHQGNRELTACPELLHDQEIRPPHSCHVRASILGASKRSPVRQPLHHPASPYMEYCIKVWSPLVVKDVQNAVEGNQTGKRIQWIELYGENKDFWTYYTSCEKATWKYN